MQMKGLGGGAKISSRKKSLAVGQHSELSVVVLTY